MAAVSWVKPLIKFIVKLNTTPKKGLNIMSKATKQISKVSSKIDKSSKIKFPSNKDLQKDVMGMSFKGEKNIPKTSTPKNFDSPKYRDTRESVQPKERKPTINETQIFSNSPKEKVATIVEEGGVGGGVESGYMPEEILGSIEDTKAEVGEIREDNASFFVQLKTSFTNGLNHIQNTQKTLHDNINGITQSVMGVGEMVHATTSKPALSIEKLINDVIMGIVEDIGFMVGLIQGTIEEVKDSILGAFDSFKNWSIEQYNKMINYFKELPNIVSNAISYGYRKMSGTLTDEEKEAEAEKKIEKNKEKLRREEEARLRNNLTIRQDEYLTELLKFGGIRPNNNASQKRYETLRAKNAQAEPERIAEYLNRKYNKGEEELTLSEIAIDTSLDESTRKTTIYGGHNLREREEVYEDEIERFEGQTYDASQQRLVVIEGERILVPVEVAPKFELKRRE